MGKGKSFSELTDREKEIAEREILRGEGLVLDDYIFDFGRTPVDVLSRGLGEHDNKCLSGMPRTGELEERIARDGYDPDFPVVFVEESGHGIRIEGGHKRLQAVVNLVNCRKVTPDYTVPTIQLTYKSAAEGVQKERAREDGLAHFRKLLSRARK